MSLNTIRVACSLWALLFSTIATAQVEPLENVSQVAAGSYHSCALSFTGGVKCFGGNPFGELGDGSTTSRSTAVDVSGLNSGVQAVVGGLNHTCALTTTGGVKCWGKNGSGQLGDGSTTTRLTPVDVAGLTTGVVAISINGSHSCALTGANGLKCWGENADGQLGDGSSTDRLVPVDVSGLTSGVLAIAAGFAHTCVVISTGGVKCFGSNASGQLGDGSTTDALTQVDVTGLASGQLKIAAGSRHSCALSSTGGMKCWGGNGSGQLGDGSNLPRLIPVDVTGMAGGVQRIVAGDFHTCATTTTSGLKCWGYNAFSQLGDGSTTNRFTPVDVTGLTNDVHGIAAGDAHTCARTGAGRMKCWGYNAFGQVGDDSTSLRLLPVAVMGLASGGVQSLAAGDGHSCALDTEGGVKCWGDNGSGQLGDGTTLIRTTAVDVSGLLAGVQAIAAGRARTCALTDLGGMKCWGANGNGQLGDGTSVPRFTPTDVSGLSSGVQSISAGDFHTCAVTTTGGAKCWGGNGSGQLGNGGTTDQPTPFDVTGLTSGVQAIAAGRVHTCALTVTGGVKCWGFNFSGQLGDNSTVTRLTPVDVVGLTSGVQAIVAGSDHTCALTTTGGVKCWGYGGVGQLGAGIVALQLTPVDAAGLTSGVQAITVGEDHTCALTSANGVKCFGGNFFGELGDGSTSNRAMPVDVASLATGAQAIVAGHSHTCAVRSAGGIRCWGYDQYGQAGDGGRNYALAADVLVDNTIFAVATLTPTANNASLAPASDASGRFVVFQSDASNLGPPDSNGASDIYRVDTDTGNVVPLSVNNDGSPIGSTSIEPSVSADGEVALFVAADAGITKLFGESSKRTQARAKASGFSVLMRNRITGTTQRMGTAQPSGSGTQPQLAPGSTAIVYTAVNINPAIGTPGQSEVFHVPLTRLGDALVPGTPRCVSCKTVGSDGVDTIDNSDGPSGAPVVSSDGQWVAWETASKNLLVDAPPPCPMTSTDIMLRNLVTGLTQRINAPAPVNCGVAGTGSRKPKADWKGNRIVFESDQPLKPGDANGVSDVYLFDLAQNRMTRVSETVSGSDGSGASTEATISGDGEMVAFVSAATNLDNEPDINTHADAHVRSVAGGAAAARRLSRTSDGNEADSNSRRPALNYNGTQLAFDSDAGNLAPGAQAGTQNVFQRANPLNSLTLFSTGFE